VISSALLARRVLAVCAALIALCSFTGCISSPSKAETGIRIGDETLGQFKAGITTQEWLVAILGEPTSWAVVEGVENTKVYRYATGEASSGLGSVFSGGSTKNTSVVYFIITDGLVTRFWADRATERTLLGKEVEQTEGEKSS
jgi:hypothetical protein